MSWFSKFSPLPGFPDYDGPHTVGSSEFEVPASSLDSSAPAPDSDVNTVSFRIFYPCQPGNEPAVRWVSTPQRGYVSAFAKFLGAGNVFSSLISYVIAETKVARSLLTL